MMHQPGGYDRIGRMTTAAIRIYGSSDDLVEIEGPGLNVEIDAYDTPVTLNTSDGTTLTMRFGPDGWKATIDRPGAAAVEIIEATDPEGSFPEYTDQVTITGVEWIQRVDDANDSGDEPPATRWAIAT